MSPEQAEGNAVDARSDIFTFGAVLYEMATGRRAFTGTSHISTLSAILHEEPEPVSRIVAGIPQELERIIVRCLKEDPVRRFQHMDDMKVALEELEWAPTKPRALKRWQWIAAAAALLVAGGIWSYLGFFPRGPTLPVPRIVPVTNYRGYEAWPALSPDGNWVADGRELVYSSSGTSGESALWRIPGRAGPLAELRSAATQSGGLSSAGIVLHIPPSPPKLTSSGWI
ncbi:MAG: protein kinase [Acidobacteria bacterium]|nr:protein kinase [Acidobacteriota bacterium]